VTDPGGGPGPPGPPYAMVIAAFAAIYLIWGSTYLGIRFAVETLPPFLMASARFLIAGGLLYAWARWRGAQRPRREHWTSALIVGGLMIGGGMGVVGWAAQSVPSGLAALVIATVPLWLVFLDGLRPGGLRPGPVTVFGVAMGIAGVAWLVGPDVFISGSLPAGAVGGLLIAPILWSVGSLRSRTASRPDNAMLATALQMLGGGVVALAIAVVLGELPRVDPGGISLRSVLAFGYLVVFGSLMGFTAYVWLLRNVSVAKVSTYAYVNPVVAVFLGWALAGEEVTARTLLAAAVIIGAVAFINLARAAPPKVASEAVPAEQ
jgi:drug/metabolite transporter (DMT)-like permease